MKEPCRKQTGEQQPKRVIRIDDSPRNVARALFGIRFDKFTRPRS